MAKDILIEIGMEEIPARFVRGAVEQLQAKMTKWLTDTHLEYVEVKAYATPRRIALLVTEVDEKQQDLEEEVKGPSKKIALDENNDWSKAALGFARSQGVEADTLFFKEINGVDYVHAIKSSIGVATDTLLSEALLDIIHSMNFPKNMRWGNHNLKFVRPIRWLIFMYGTDVIPLEITGVQSGNTTKGHRFLGKEVTITKPHEYVSLLKEEYVIADIEERRLMIVEQIEQMAAEKQWKISVNEELLEEVLFLVEYPTALSGSYDAEFLIIPQEVLITSMREHQRYFPVLDQEGALLPYFVTVRNGNSVSLDQVARGNEKVLRARLSDAKFFYQEDQKLAIDAALARLEKVVFHEELGTIGDKTRRIGQLAERISELLNMNEHEAQLVTRAAAICKFDLVTQMVYEFPELQGVMGLDYALKAGEDAKVARVMLEHYQPRFSGDVSPASLVGAIVSIADKMDTILGCISIGIIPTGSQDPYALRRQAAGIVQILNDHQLSCKLSELFDASLKVYESVSVLKRDEQDIRSDLKEFFALRVKNMLSDHLRYDLVDAVMSVGFDDIPSVIRRGDVVKEAILQHEMKSVIESFNRVNNLASKASSSITDPSLFIELIEHELFNAWEQIKPSYKQQLAEGHETQALQLICELREPITRYFDTVMVMADDIKVKENRLGLLSDISVHLNKFADFQKIVW